MNHFPNFWVKIPKFDNYHPPTPSVVLNDYPLQIYDPPERLPF